ncbi:MAG: hypothetical protein HYR84_13200, partial [Planctomycetes bacterium]|nr:hypothetical protein [Planctomycetota bacterium]
MRTYCYLFVGVLAGLGLAAPAYGQRIEVQPLQPRLIGDTPLLTPEGVEKLK